MFVVSAPMPMTKAPSVNKDTYVDIRSNHHWLWRILGLVRQSYYQWQVGLTRNGLLLVDSETNRLVKYSVDEGQAKKEFEKALPYRFDAYWSKCLLSDGRIVLEEDSCRNCTHIYTANLDHLISFNNECDSLIGTLPPDLLVYQVDSNRCELHIYSVDNNHQQVMTLKSTEGKEWSGFLSVCKHPYTGYMAVVDSHYSTLDIYNEDGRSDSHLYFTFHALKVNKNSGWRYFV